MYALIKVKVKELTSEEPTTDVSILGAGGDKQALLKQMIDSVGNFYGWEPLDDFYKECRKEIHRQIMEGCVQVVVDPFGDSELHYWTVKEI